MVSWPLDTNQASSTQKGREEREDRGVEDRPSRQEFTTRWTANRCMDEPIVRSGPLLGEHLGRLLHRPTHHHSKRTEGSKRERRGELERVRKRSRVTAWRSPIDIALGSPGLRRGREASNGLTEECSAVHGEGGRLPEEGVGVGGREGRWGGREVGHVKPCWALVTVWARTSNLQEACPCHLSRRARCSGILWQLGEMAASSCTRHQPMQARRVQARACRQPSRAGTCCAVFDHSQTLSLSVTVEKPWDEL
jgi:hypothetical protein